MQHKGSGSDGEMEKPARASVSPLARRAGHAEIIQFPRSDTAASVPAGCSETSSGHPQFQILGSAVQAVVLRVANKRVRLQVMIPSDEGLAGGATPDGTDDGSLGG